MVATSPDQRLTLGLETVASVLTPLSKAVGKSISLNGPLQGLKM